MSYETFYVVCVHKMVCADFIVVFFFQAEDGIRYIGVTGVQTCALPIYQPRVGSAPYDAAKGGLGLLVKTLALELGEYGITANAVAPGEIATPMTGQEDEDPREKSRPGVPLGRPGDAREIAAV